MGDNDEERTIQFHEMELDDRILKAIAKLGWQKPTLVQEKAIPLLIEGKDVLMRARTGSGKTAAFTIPAVQTVLNLKQTSTSQETVILMVAPSRELCSQIHIVMKDLTMKCSREVNCLDISGQVDIAIQKPLLAEKPDIVIGTPSKLLQHIKAGNLSIKDSLKMLIVDEADLVFSFGYENEFKSVLTYLPKIYQAVLASATLSDDVKNLKALVLHNPVTLKLEEPDLAPSSQLIHYHLAAEEMEKATILYALLKLHLVRGKTIIFVSTVDRCYKIKLFLEQFGIPTCVLNSELPAKVRCHSVEQFNKGLYDVIIASDELSLEQPGGSDNVDKKIGKRRKDKESGVSRGIDFQCVANVINFDFPLDVGSYVHRAGRTARGNNKGTVLSFVSIRERPLMNEVEEYMKTQGHEADDGSVIKSYQFKIEEIEAFRYRARDAWKAVTRIAVREARLKEIKQEIFNCQKLKSYFEDNPTDLEVLRHDKALHTVKKQQHLTDVPDYIVPPALKNLTGVTTHAKRKRTNYRSTKTAENRYKKKMSDPLLGMQFTGFKKKKTK